MNRAWGMIDQAWRDTLVHAAQDRSFNRLSRFFGFFKQPGIHEGSWRRALLELAWGRRGTNDVTFNVVRHCLRQFDTEVEVEVRPSEPNRLYFVAAEGMTSFRHDHVGRFIDTPYGMFWSDGPRMGGGISSCTRGFITLSPTATHFNSAPTWNFTTYTRFKIRILPFLYYVRQPGPVDPQDVASAYHPGNPCLIEVYILGSGVPTAPTTYLQEDGQPTEAGVPYGGNLLDDETVQGDSQGDGPHPLYLVDAGVLEGVRVEVERTLAAGCFITFTRLETPACTPLPSPPSLS